MSSPPPSSILQKKCDSIPQEKDIKELDGLFKTFKIFINNDPRGNYYFFCYLILAIIGANLAKTLEYT